MTTTEKEARINGKPYPWQELMELAQWRRDERLKTLDDRDVHATDIEQEYDDALDGILVTLKLA
jgi:hypothetical protein